MPSKTSWKNQFQEVENSSKFHCAVRTVFRTDTFFKNLKCFQEVNVQDLIPEYPYYNHHYDWYVEELQLVIELHGRQHYEIVNFGNASATEAEKNFYRIRDRDNTKKTWALESGFRYKEIPYTYSKKITSNTLKTLLLHGD